MKYFFILSVIVSLLLGNNLEMFNLAIDKNDYSRAKVIIRPDAIGGNVKAMFNLGLLEYVTGSEKKALAWLQPAADGGLTRANTGIGIILFSRSQKKESLQKAALAFQKEKNSKLASHFSVIIDDLLNGTDNAPADSYYRIALLYKNNPIILPNKTLSFSLMQRAADKGMSEASLKYGKMLLRKGGENSIWEALKYFNLAALAGNDEALYLEGKVYLEGPRGVRNLEKGEALMDQAVKNGYKKSTKTVEKSVNMLFLSY